MVALVLLLVLLLVEGSAFAPSADELMPRLTEANFMSSASLGLFDRPDPVLDNPEEGALRSANFWSLDFVFGVLLGLGDADAPFLTTFEDSGTERFFEFLAVGNAFVDSLDFADRLK